MNSLQREIDGLSAEDQSDLHNVLKDHLMALGILEPVILTEDQQIILEDRIERYNNGECKGISWEKVKKNFKDKYHHLNFDDSPLSLLSQEFIGKVLKLLTREKIELFKLLQQAADIAFQQMLQKINMTEEHWNRIHGEMYVHFSAKYKIEADEIRKRKGF